MTRILVVEDDEEIQHFLKNAEQYDAIIVDIQLVDYKKGLIWLNSYGRSRLFVPLPKKSEKKIKRRRNKAVKLLL
ncbi:hypothetical protein [Oceanobacillus senegalensis]|uniref:hypothetical protein n=1 Tax=Oceanobacillus senegalensis TaxID=1936063 RepID=UPI000A3134ED|nr:hypothetical protein [Oceanobacillus senegalensis]